MLPYTLASLSGSFKRRRHSDRRSSLAAHRTLAILTVCCQNRRPVCLSYLSPILRKDDEVRLGCAGMRLECRSGRPPLLRSCETLFSLPTLKTFSSKLVPPPQLILIISFTVDLIVLVSLNAPFLLKLETDRVYFFAIYRWNYFISGLNSIDNRTLWNVVLLIKLLLGLLQFTTLPLMIIGNRTGRSSYLKPYKAFGLINLTFALGVSLYFLFGYTDVSNRLTFPVPI